MKAYYFGCWRKVGHFFYEPGMRKAPHAAAREGQAAALIVPWGHGVDGKLCPSGPQVEGRALMHYRDGWSALAKAREIFPEVFERFDFDVVSV